MPLRPLTQNHQALYNPLPLADFTPTSPSATYLESGVSSTLAAAPGWAYTRAGAAFAYPSSPGVATSFATDTPRVTDVGLLIENAAQNIITYSTNYQATGTNWGNIFSGTGLIPVVVHANATAPDGTTTADTVTFNRGVGTSGDYSLLAKTLSITGTYVQAIWVRADSPCNISLLGPNAVYRKVAVTTTWQRITNSAAVVTTGYIQIGLNQSTPGGVDQTAVVQLWNSQTELGTVPSSDILTTTVAVTRPADAATITLTGIRYSDVIANGITTTAAASSPFNLGGASGGAWVGYPVTRLVLR